MTLEFTVTTIEQTAAVAKTISEGICFPSCVYLNGAMGAGKTTLSKHIINSLGYDGAVTSPTYNLIQEYRVTNGIVYHMDLYRLKEPSEIEFLGLEDLWSNKAVFLIEWPQNGGSYIPSATAEISLQVVQELTEKTRKICVQR